MGKAVQTIRVEVVYALPERQCIVPLECPLGTTISQAIQYSGMLTEFPELAAQDYEVGIYGRKQTCACRLTDQDRIEIYRPLQVTPAEARRRRALARKKPQFRRNADPMA